MGVPELMKRMKSHCIEVHDWLVLAQGCRVGIDTMVWLHVFVAVFYSDVNSDVKEYGRIVGHVCKRLQKMIDSGVHVVPVLDGAPDGAKAVTNETREAQRLRKVKMLTTALEEEGLEGTSEIDDLLARATARITPDLVDCLIQALRTAGIPFIVAPHEADHQLAHMAQCGHIDYIITVDSDLLCHRGTKIIVTSSGDFFGGPAKVFTPGRQQHTKMERDDIGNLISKALMRVRGIKSGLYIGDEEVGAAVCLGYALLVGNDYGKMSEGFGAVSAFNALEYLIEESKKEELFGRPELLYTPEHLVEATRKVSPENRNLFRGDIISDVSKARNAFTKGLVYFLSNEPRDRLIMPMDGSEWSEDLRYLGMPERNLESAVLRALVTG